MNCRQTIYQLLTSLGLYRLGRGTLVDAELEAYLWGLEPLEEQLDSLMQGLFPQTSSQEQLTLWERRVGLPVKPNVPLENRREMVRKRLSISPNSYTQEGLVDSIASVGLQAEIISLGNGKIQIQGAGYTGEFASLDEVQRAVEVLLPAHLQAVFDLGYLTCQDLDQKDLSWEKWDRMDFTFQQFDLSQLPFPEKDSPSTQIKEE